MGKKIFKRNLHQKLRITGGQWRGRKFAFEQKEELRPTKDIVRETLFNWLDPFVRNAKCLDLFCGSGILGLEALSRGARHCDFVDYCQKTANALSSILLELKANDLATVHNDRAEHYLSKLNKRYDIVFIDPPFQSELIQQTALMLSSKRLIAPEGAIYIEFPAADSLAEVPTEWQLYRKKQTGKVKYCLYRQP